jgi:hypothetical protein
MSKVGQTLWLSSLPYPFTAFFSSLKKRQSVLLITAIMERIAWLSPMKFERGVVLRRALLQKRKNFPIQNISRENGRFFYTPAKIYQTFGSYQTIHVLPLLRLLSWLGYPPPRPVI